MGRTIRFHDSDGVLCDPVLQSQARDAAKVFGIVGHQGQIVRASRCRNQQIQILDQFSFLPQSRLDVAKGSGGFRINSKNGERADEIVYGVMVYLGPR